MNNRQNGGNPPLFGVGIYPPAQGLEQAFKVARFADQAGLECGWSDYDGERDECACGQVRCDSRLALHVG